MIVAILRIWTFSRTVDVLESWALHKTDAETFQALKGECYAAGVANAVAQNCPQSNVDVVDTSSSNVVVCLFENQKHLEAFAGIKESA